jgi:hypothetical protein
MIKGDKQHYHLWSGDEMCESSNHHEKAPLNNTSEVWSATLKNYIYMRSPP